MLNASRVSSTALSSISFEGNDRLDQSVFHYDIREADSLLEESDHRNYSLVSSETIVLSNRPVSTEQDIPKRSSCSTQTCALLDSEELEELKRDFIPHLEEQISLLESTRLESGSRYDHILSRVKQYSIFEPVRGSMDGNSESANFFLGADEQSLDIFAEAGDDTPVLSLPLRGMNVRVSAKHRIVSFFVLKSSRFVVYVDDMYRFKKLLFCLKLLGLSVSLVDVPEESIGKSIVGDTENPRRHVVRDQ